MTHHQRQLRNYLVIACLSIVVILLAVNYFKEEPRTNPLQVSLVQRNVSDEYSQLALKQGIDQGVIEHGLELSVVFFEDSLDPEEQLSLVKKEIDNGAEGLLIETLDDPVLGAYLNKLSRQLPVVLLNNQVKEAKDLRVIQSDNFTMGETLGEFILVNGKQPRKRILLLKNNFNYEEVKSQYQGVRSVLDQRQFSLATCELTGTEEEQKAELERLLLEDNYECIVAFSLRELESLSMMKQRHESLAEMELYGFGKTNMIISGLEEGLIEGIAVSNQYAVGYLGVRELADSTETHRVAPVEYNVITKETIFAKENEQFLFPFIQ